MKITGIKLVKALLTSVVLVVASVLPLQQATAQDMMQSGTFSGLNNHVATGKVELVKTDAGYVIKLGADFIFDGAPDPKIAFGNDGEYDPATLIEPLKSNSGEQSYVVPASIDASQFNEVYIWCEKFSVGLGVASLK